MICTITDKLNVPTVKLDDEINRLNRKNCHTLGFTYINMLSGASHDAMVMAELTKVALIFVHSKSGRSHCPEE